MLLDSVSDVKFCAKCKKEISSWQNIAKRKLEWYPYKLSHPKMALNNLTQILKHDNHIMCFGPNDMEHASILSQNKHSSLKSSSSANNQTKIYDGSRKNTLLNIMHQTISSI
jgi:hypothetical protein